MKKHVKQCSLDPGSCDLLGFQKVGKLGKGFILIPAGENPSGKSVGHVQVCAQAFFCFLKKTVTVKRVQIACKKSSREFVGKNFFAISARNAKFCIEVSDDSDKKQWECSISDESPMGGALKSKIAFRIAEAEGK